MKNIESLCTMEKDMLLYALLYFMSMETRHKIMRLLPTVYNKVVGDEIMEVTNTRQ